MKNNKAINYLVIGIIVLSSLVSMIGIFSSGGPGKHEIVSFRGETITIYGTGIYKDNSVSVAVQGIAQDIVTVILGVPLLIISLYLSVKGLLRGKLLLTGTLGYFLYTYISYVFLWMYNPLFILYVVLMSASFFAFVLSIMSIDREQLRLAIQEKLPVKFIGGFQIFFAVALCLLWLKKIIPTIKDELIPVGIEHYTTLVIQGMDLGFVVPAALLSGILLLKRSSYGYLLSSIIIIKGFTMGAALTAMILGQYLAGVTMGITEIIMFPIFCLIILYCLFALLKNVKTP